MESSKGLKYFLKFSSLYQFFQDLIGNKKGRSDFLKRYLGIKEGDIVLDIGCGTGEIVTHMPIGVKYIGVDYSQKYISHAEKKYGHLGQFYCSDISDIDYSELGYPDFILMKGILHHLSDQEVLNLFQSLHTVLKGYSAVLLTIDPCFVENQKKLSRFLVSQDRGEDVRTPDGYLSLAKSSFDKIEHFERDDLIKIPYNHFIMKCYFNPNDK